jgi:hypothetical protein
MGRRIGATPGQDWSGSDLARERLRDRCVCRRSVRVEQNIKNASGSAILWRDFMNGRAHLQHLGAARESATTGRVQRAAAPGAAPTAFVARANRSRSHRYFMANRARWKSAPPLTRQPTREPGDETGLTGPRNHHRKQKVRAGYVRAGSRTPLSQLQYSSTISMRIDVACSGVTAAPTLCGLGRLRSLRDRGARGREGYPDAFL